MDNRELVDLLGVVCVILTIVYKAGKLEGKLDELIHTQTNIEKRVTTLEKVQNEHAVAIERLS